MQMTCPKCHGEMRVYERSGVTVDQCTECRGIFLDRGELEKLFEAEANFNTSRSSAPRAPQAPGYAAAPPPAAYGAPGAYPPAGYAQPGYGQPSHHGHYKQRGHHGHYKRRKNSSFLGQLFD